ncbi:hypothetical protein [Tsuneonella mangrovi]|uniref:hypothetical protein n=1 Tax=Tsuneonella mangrovi TaxID=1982042 RepID=UPI000BA241B3|nr:hypothetical protein [Tsuneonella mangrovi]
MTEDTTPASGGDDRMRGVVTNYGNLSGNSESIPAEHLPYADQILKMDPINDVPGNVASFGGVRPIQLKASGLPDDMRSEVYRRLELKPNMPKEDRAKYESQLVEEVVREKRGAIRSQTGVHRDALPFHKEQADIAMQVRDLYRKRDGFQEALDRVVDVTKAEDPATGELVAEPVYWLSETKRQAYRNNIADIDRQVRLLVGPDGSFGIEGRKRMEKALAESAALLHRQQQQKANREAIKKRASEITREKYIEEQAQALARMRPDPTQ